MKKLIVSAAAAAMAVAMPASPAMADDHAMEKPELLEQDWYRIEMLKFKGGNRKRIGEILEMFSKADEASGQDGPFVMHMNSGAWDMAVFFKMEHGVQQMGWKSTPEGDAWDKAFAEMVGGEEAAMKIFVEWQSMIAMSETHIGHHHPDKED